jgi:hypothetical protein
MMDVGRRVVRSDIILPASQLLRLSRTIRMATHAIFFRHFSLAVAVGIRIEQASHGP